MSKVLTPEIISHIGETFPTKNEIVTRRDIRKYSIATGQRKRKFLDGDVAPPLFHLSLFLCDMVELDQLRADGLPNKRLIPDVPLKKEMAGGLEIEYHKPIYPGDCLTATQTLTDIYEKEGSKGPIIFYEVLMEIVNQMGEKITSQKTTFLCH